MKLVLILLIVPAFAFAANPFANYAFKKSLKEANKLLVQEKSLLQCPGVDLVVTCGNKLCEPHLNESTDNCAADCLPNVHVRSYNNITLCQGYNEIQIPQNVHEVADIIKKAVSENKKVRAIGASHSATDVMCAEGILVPMNNFDKIKGIEILNNQKVVRVEAGVTIFKLSEWLHEHGYALLGQPHMGFRDVTIGGSIATGSHGSTPKHHGVISNIIEGIQVVDGKGIIHEYLKNTTDEKIFKSLTASLGLLGITTEFLLKVEPQFNLDVQISFHKEDEVMNKGLLNFVSDCDYGQYNWFPGIKKMMKTCGKRTTLPANMEANNELLSPNIGDIVVNPFKKALQIGACNNKIMCAIEQVRWWQYKIQPPMVVTKASGKKSFYKRLRGPSHRMVSSHLFAKQEGFFQMDWEIAVPESRAQEAFLAISEHVKKYQTCLPLVGVFIRFAPIEDEALLAHTTATGGDWKKGDTAVFFEMPVYVPVGFDKEKFAEYEKQFVEFAKMLITNYSGRPHWGKNRQWAFDLALSLNRYNQNLESFQSAINELDPHGTFANEFGRKLNFTWSSKR